MSYARLTGTAAEASAGRLGKTRTERPFEYEANEVNLSLSSGEATRTITPALIEAIARRTENGDLDVYIDRHGIDGLATAIGYAHEYVDGTVNHRIMAREVDLSPLEAEIVLQAPEPIVRAERRGSSSLIRRGSSVPVARPTTRIGGCDALSEKGMRLS